jgi:hypothetical protein
MLGRLARITALLIFLFYGIPVLLRLNMLIELNMARHKWARADLSNYDIQMQSQVHPVDCDLPEWTTLKVRGNHVVAVGNQTISEQRKYDSPYRCKPYSVTSLFNRIEREIWNPEFSFMTWSHATFDPTYGFVTEFRTIQPIPYYGYRYQFRDLNPVRP